MSTEPTSHPDLPVSSEGVYEEALRLAEIGEYLYSACAYSYGDGYTEPREFGIDWQWQQSKPDEYGQGMLLAAASKWHEEQAEEGAETEAAKLRRAAEAFPVLLDALQRIVSPAPGVSQKAPAWVYGIARAAISKATRLEPSSVTQQPTSLRSDREANVQTMTDAELVAELNRCAFHFDRRGEHGGSPGEYWAERAMEIETLQRRRAAVSENPEPTP